LALKLRLCKSPIKRTGHPVRPVPRLQVLRRMGNTASANSCRTSANNANHHNSRKAFNPTQATRKAEVQGSTLDPIRRTVKKRRGSRSGFQRNPSTPLRFGSDFVDISFGNITSGGPKVLEFLKTTAPSKSLSGLAEVHNTNSSFYNSLQAWAHVVGYAEPSDRPTKGTLGNFSFCR
jgi:hypothetical protein